MSCEAVQHCPSVRREVRCCRSRTHTRRRRGMEKRAVRCRLRRRPARVPVVAFAGVATSRSRSHHGRACRPSRRSGDVDEPTHRTLQPACPGAVRESSCYVASPPAGIHDGSTKGPIVAGPLGRWTWASICAPLRQRVAPQLSRDRPPLPPRALAAARNRSPEPGPLEQRAHGHARCLGIAKLKRRSALSIH